MYLNLQTYYNIHTSRTDSSFEFHFLKYQEKLPSVKKTKAKGGVNPGGTMIPSKSSESSHNLCRRTCQCRKWIENILTRERQLGREKWKTERRAHTSGWYELKSCRVVGRALYVLHPLLIDMKYIYLINFRNWISF
jgi:hypothetical protein